MAKKNGIIIADKEFNEKDEVKERTKYIPPMTHPWKLSSFKKQLQKAHTNHVYA